MHTVARTESGARRLETRFARRVCFIFVSSLPGAQANLKVAGAISHRYTFILPTTHRTHVLSLGHKDLRDRGLAPACTAHCAKFGVSSRSQTPTHPHFTHHPVSATRPAAIKRERQRRAITRTATVELRVTTPRWSGTWTLPFTTGHLM